MNGYSAIALRLGDAGWWVLSSGNCQLSLDPNDDAFPEIAPGVKAHAAEADGRLPVISFQAGPNGSRIIRLLETRAYDWDLPGTLGARVSSSLEDLRAGWRVRRGSSLTGSFTVVNHLGAADFVIEAAGATWRFDLEFVSRKLDFDLEFRAITEDIATFCQQLLLQWDAPTSLRFAANPAETARLDLERFLFLRGWLTPERLEEIVEAVHRNPHTCLVRERDWTPSAAAGSNDWLSDPTSMARDWHRVGGRKLPASVVDIRKSDSTDTPPNRFVRFSLESFRDLCRSVIEKHPGALTLTREACDLANALDSVLARPFFRDIGRMSRLPLEHPLLHQRHGYRDVLRLWLLTEAAASLRWDRDDDTHQGPTRNVATLYEYWIFLQLHEILDGIEGMTRDTGNPRPADDAAPFLRRENGELVISLRRGRKTCAPFTLTLASGAVMRVHLYYERAFQWEQAATAAASYSRQFKPDYTLAIFPVRFENEADAVAAGKIAYLHFDAKYRAEDITSVFGEADVNLDREKEEAKATSTYNRGDLLKMHTYNDAVRRTAGSYVLYPGNDDHTELQKFHEIVPGVGAFVLKPGNEAGRDQLKAFLMDVFQHQSNQFTQYRFLADQEHTVLRDAPVEHETGKSYRPTASCIFVYLKDEQRELCRHHKLAYAHALRDEVGTPVPLKLGDAAGAVFCPYSSARTGPRHTLAWQASILSTEMLTVGALQAKLRQAGWPEDQMPSKATAYLLFRLDEPVPTAKREITALLPPGAFHAVSEPMSRLFGCPVSYR